jgi:hypothetical protein
MPVVKQRTRWTSQPQVPVGIDWGNPITNGLERALNFTRRVSRELAKGVSVTYGSNIVPLNQGYGIFGVGLKDIAGGNSAISVASWANTTSEATVVLLQERGSTSNNEWLELGTTGNVDHFPYGGLVYSDAFWNSRWISGASIPAGKSFTKPHIIALSVKNGSQRAYWDGALWVSASNTGGFTLPSTLSINTGTGFIGTFYAAFFFSRALSPAEVKSLSDNPWQIFAP